MLRVLSNVPIWQRLQWIKQTGMLYVQFPVAEHSRYDHSVGTAHLASEYGRKLDFPNDMHRVFVLAAALHDIGHGPMSHTFERCTPFHHDAKRHELMRTDEHLRSALGPDTCAEICNVWNGGPSPWHRVANTLIAGVAGVDRMQYLPQDRRYLGVHEVAVPSVRPAHIHAIMDGTSVNWETGQVRYTPEACVNIEHVLRVRRCMFHNYYFNRYTVAADMCLRAAFDLGASKYLPSPDTHFAVLTDACVLALASATFVPPPIRYWISRAQGIQYAVEHEYMSAEGERDAYDQLEPYVPAEVCLPCNTSFDSLRPPDLARGTLYASARVATPGVCAAEVDPAVVLRSDGKPITTGWTAIPDVDKIVIMKLYH